jgi:N-acetylglutamate synthase-like GNAT family acetyltransferase
VAVRADRVVGYVALTTDFFHQPFIEMLVVGADERRSGVGLALVEHCIAETPPATKLWSSTNRSNVAMQALLGKAGFVQSGVVDHLDEGDPELIYLCPLVETDP